MIVVAIVVVAADVFVCERVVAVAAAKQFVAS